ncbi:MAG: UPF0182 family protein [Acidimicrobiia bacterium]|nr:UPF0182 family protein [Acidimicrobiia bacterium]MYF26599.1 UPF0182 family protein [Acidimicrobiia bacterium]
MVCVIGGWGVIRTGEGSAGRSGRSVLRSRLGLVLVTVFIVGLLVVRLGAVAWTDYLWYRSVDATSVWTTILISRVILGAIGVLVAALVIWVNLEVVQRVKNNILLVGGPDDEVVRRLRALISENRRLAHIGVSIILGLLLGLAASSWWQDVLLWRNGVSFDKADPIFGSDASFYVFALPVYRSVLSWFIQLVVVAGLVSVAYHYLNGGIQRIPNRFPVFSGGVKSHVSVLLAALAILKAVAYRLDAYDLLYSTRGAIYGASYTDVTAHRPALFLLMAISILAAGLLLWNIRQAGWLLVGVAAGLWLIVSVVVGGVIPAAIERFRVQPNQFNLERPYIEHHIEFTLDAYGMGEGQVEVRDFAASRDLTAQDIVDNQATISNVKLWDPGVLAPAYSQLQAIRPYYQISNVDTDRYVIDGELTQVMVAARELDSDDLPAEGWVNEKLVYTHGFGEVVSRANDVNPTTGEPDFLVRDVPPKSIVPELQTAQPRIYYGEAAETGDYVIARTNQMEVDYPSGEDDSVVRNTYEGEGGVELSNLTTRAAMAFRFGDLNILISPELTPESRMLMVRNVVDRLALVAPFLVADNDPYLALIEGRTVWIVDLYSTTDRYPYSAPVIDDRLGLTSGLGDSFNYIRNSVKAVVDAEDGTMKLYVLEPTDPLTQAYRNVFPEVFSDASEISEELHNHLRYPEDMFRVQSEIYATYHQQDPQDFFQEEDKWQIPGEPATSDRELLRGDFFDQTGRVRLDLRQSLPYYLLMKLPGEADLSYLILQSFNPASRENMTAFLVGKSGPEDYGAIIDYRLPRGELINGLQQVSARIDQDPIISQQFTLLGQQGSEIIRGNMLVVPVEESLLFIQPIYLRAEGVLLPEFKRVVVVYGEQNPPIMSNSLDEALVEIFGPAAAVAETSEEPISTPGSDDPLPSGEGDVQTTVLQIDQLLNEADQALRSGDLGLYQTKVDEAARLTDRLVRLIGESAS